MQQSSFTQHMKRIALEALPRPQWVREDWRDFPAAVAEFTRTAVRGTMLLAFRILVLVTYPVSVPLLAFLAMKMEQWMNEKPESDNDL